MIGELFEEILQLALECAIAGSKSSKVPAPLRWVLRVIVFVVYAFILGIMILAAIAFFRYKQIALGILMVVLCGVFAAVTIVKAIKVIKQK